MDGKVEGHTKYIENTTYFALSTSILPGNLRARPAPRRQTIHARL